MANIIHGQSSAAASLTAGTTVYCVMQNSSNSSGRTTESDVQLARTISGQYLQLNIRVSGNTIDTGNIVFTSRKNTADGNLTATIAAGVSGFIQDLTDVDSVSVNDKYDFKIVTGGTTGNQNFVSSTVFVTNTTAADHAVMGAMTINAASTTTYIFPNGQFASDATEANVQIKIKNTATVKNMQIVVNSNTKVAAVTFKSRKNTADGALLVSITAGVTGIFTDLTHSDSLVATDLYCLVGISGAGSGNFGTTDVQTQWSYGSNVYDLFSVSSVIGGVARAASGTQSFTSPFGNMTATFNATEAARQQVVPTPVTLAKFSCNVIANTYSVSATSRLRKNTANGNGNLTITNAVTGVYEDASSTDTCINTDVVAYGVTGGTSGSATFAWFAAQATDTFSPPTIQGASTVQGISTIKF